MKTGDNVILTTFVSRQNLVTGEITEFEKGTVLKILSISYGFGNARVIEESTKKQTTIYFGDFIPFVSL